MKKIIIILICILHIYPTNITTPQEENIISYLTIPNLINNEPITQYKDNDYYLNHDINNKINITGATFLDYRNKISDKIIIIYGHNSRTYKTPFQNLEKYYKKEAYKKYNKIILSNNQYKRIYKIFSVILINKNYFYTNLTPENYLKHLNEIKNMSIYKTDINLSKEDNIIILQTCSYKNNKEFLLIVGKEI